MGDVKDISGFDTKGIVDDSTTINKMIGVAMKTLQKKHESWTKHSTYTAAELEVMQDIIFNIEHIKL